MKKSWKLILLNAMIENLIVLSALEQYPVFQDVFLDCLENALHYRKQLLHS